MMEEEKKNNRVLLVLDVSNFEHVVLNSAHSTWAKKHPEDSTIIKSVNDTDQDNLPNLLTVDSFVRVLHKEVQDRLESLKWIAKSHHQDEIDVADGIDVVFTEDSPVSENFRRKLYPEYKAQRSLLKYNFNKPVIKAYIQDVIFKELDIENKLGYKIIKVQGCESDDIIAVLMNNYRNYSCRILVSSDRDFLQLEDVNQYDMWGKKVKFHVKFHEDYKLETKEFLYWKIVNGDKSDNIKHVFPKCGDVKSYRLIKDKATLKRMLMEDQEAAERFMLNKKLIDFREIPKEMEERILKAIEEKLGTPSQKEEVERFSVESCLSI